MTDNNDIVFFKLAANRELWNKFKRRAKTEGRSLRWLLTEMIKQCVERGLE